GGRDAKVENGAFHRNRSPFCYRREYHNRVQKQPVFHTLNSASKNGAFCWLFGNTISRGFFVHPGMARCGDSELARAPLVLRLSGFSACGFGWGAALTGGRTVKTDPWPGSRVTVTPPPIMRASLGERAGPGPVPP